MNWIKDHMKFIIIMVVITLLVAIIIISSVNSGKQNTLKSGVQSTVAAVAEPVSAAGNGISSFFSGLIHFRDNQKENYQLKQELEALQEELGNTRLSVYELEQLQSLSNELNMASYDDTYRRITAEVISLDSADIFNIFNISAGTEDGVKLDDIVINQDGLVGRIMSVGKHWAKVQGCVDSSNAVSFSLIRDPSVTGIISGTGKGGMSGYLFDETQSVVEGDILVTSGIGYYPQGIVIGEVSAVSLDSETKQKTVEANSSVNFKSIRYVTVLSGSSAGVQIKAEITEESGSGQ